MMGPETFKTTVDSVAAFSTCAMAFLTFALVLETRRAAARQISVNTWLTLESRFDSGEMKQARKKFSQQLKTYSTSKHSKISETVLNFFESVGTAYKIGCIDRELADSSFSFYAVRYWEASKAYIDQEQKRHNADTTLFQDFGDLAASMRCSEDKITSETVETFLDDEARLD